MRDSGLEEGCFARPGWFSSPRDGWFRRGEGKKPVLGEFLFSFNKRDCYSINFPRKRSFVKIAKRSLATSILFTLFSFFWKFN